MLSKGSRPPRRDSKLTGSPGDPCGRNHRLRGRATEVDAGAAEVLALRNRDAPAVVRELSRQRERCLPGANDYNIVVIHFKPGSRGTARSRFDCTGLLISFRCQFSPYSNVIGHPSSIEDPVTAYP
jgi:hypothetical protein